MSTKLLLLLDFSNIFYRGFHVHKNLSWRGIPTGGFYGLIQQIASQIYHYKPHTLIVCDDKRPYFRSRIFPGYKQGRPQLDPEVSEMFFQNRHWAEEIIEALGIPHLRYEGLEADDLLAACAKELEQDFDEIVIVSNDSDLYQLLTQDNLTLLVGTGDKKRELTRKKFSVEYPDIAPEDWLDVIAMSGGHNGLPGIRGVAEKTAIKALNGDVSAGKKVLPYTDLIKLSKQIAYLPFKYFRGYDKIVNESFSGQYKYNKREMMGLLARRGIQLTKLMDDSFSLLTGRR